MDLYDFMNHDSMGGGEADPRYPNRRGSSVWGWVGPKGRQIALIGQHTGTAFVEIDKKGKLTYLGRLPAQDGVGSSWREIRVLKDYAIIGSEAVGHNVQIFDLNKVAAIDPKKPVTFNKDTDLVSVFDDLPIGRAHNVSFPAYGFSAVVNTELRVRPKIDWNETRSLSGSKPMEISGGS